MKLDCDRGGVPNSGSQDPKQLEQEDKEKKTMQRLDCDPVKNQPRQHERWEAKAKTAPATAFKKGGRTPARKCGGKVEGEASKMHMGRAPRKSGGSCCANVMAAAHKG